MIVLEDKDVDLKRLSKLIDSTPLSFASSERLNKYLGVYPGAVGPFGLINDVANHVQVVLDSDILNKDTINFHPNVNTATVNLSVQDFRRYLDWKTNPPREIFRRAGLGHGRPRPARLFHPLFRPTRRAV